MVKKIRSLYIENEIYEKFQKQWPGEVSIFCEEAMSKRLNFHLNSNYSVVDTEILMIEKRKIQESLDNSFAKMREIEEREELNKQLMEQSEVDRLQKEREEYEKLFKCNGCGGMISPQLKKYKFGEDVFCESCFQNEHPKMVASMRVERTKRINAEDNDEQ